ncbi:hypothetical protein GYMLUDRAFT_242543 [Collybiopsis luxurians FD-317 M1]|uniref:Uncharacterized protein n=1 Tax=Collybiopsis luxurians FD-317 M1 TaxID=944289 RepID=A0A0D0BEY5_9AGAR|nr:hypothetical protein GYMLUDRAFT_242543 [Collybiopsis luxurians FD-317 M1]
MFLETSHSETLAASAMLQNYWRADGRNSDDCDDKREVTNSNDIIPDRMNEANIIQGDAIQEQVENSSTFSQHPTPSATVDIEPLRRRRRSKSVDAEFTERRRDSSTGHTPYPPAKDTPHMFNSSENFSINGGHFNTIGGNMNSNTYNDESTMMIFNQCTFSNDNPSDEDTSPDSYPAFYHQAPSSPYSAVSSNSCITFPPYPRPKPNYGVSDVLDKLLLRSNGCQLVQLVACLFGMLELSWLD